MKKHYGQSLPPGMYKIWIYWSPICSLKSQTVNRPLCMWFFMTFVIVEQGVLIMTDHFSSVNDLNVLDSPWSGVISNRLSKCLAFHCMCWDDRKKKNMHTQTGLSSFSKHQTHWMYLSCFQIQTNKHKWAQTQVLDCYYYYFQSVCWCTWTR